MIYFMIDAFTNEKFGGNPAGVVIYQQTDATFMQAFAAEVGFSETAFVKQIDNKTFDVRFFTPNTEVDLCGHATVATFKALLHENLVQENQTYFMKTIAGTLTIKIEQSLIVMEQAQPKLGQKFENVEELAALFNIDPTLIGDHSHQLIPQAASIGLWDIMLPLKTKEALYALNPNFEAITAFTTKHNVAGIHAFTLDAQSTIAESRNFCPRYDINEEAATGTSTGALTYYLSRNKISFNNTDFLTFSQGKSMARPSTIRTKLIEGTPTKILVGGEAVILSRGEIY